MKMMTDEGCQNLPSQKQIKNYLYQTRKKQHPEMEKRTAEELNEYALSKNNVHSHLDEVFVVGFHVSEIPRQNLSFHVEWSTPRLMQRLKRQTLFQVNVVFGLLINKTSSSLQIDVLIALDCSNIKEEWIAGPAYWLQEDVYSLDEAFNKDCSRILFYSVSFIVWTITIGFALSVLANLGSFNTFALIILTYIILPNCLYGFVCWKLARDYDAQIRKFFSFLRQREICLFGVNHPKAGIKPTTSYKKQRQICLQQIRANVKLLVKSSEILAAYREESDKLLTNFINDDLRLLSGLDNGLVGEAADNDEFLQIGSLKNCWQFMFLVRSEFIRLSLVSLLEFNLFFDQGQFVFCGPRISHLCSVLCLILKTFWSLFSVKLNLSTNMLVKPRGVASSEICFDGKQAATELSPLDSCIVQVEWVLENLQTCHKDLPSNPSALIACLQNVVSLMSTTHSLSNGGDEVEVEGNSSDSFYEEDIIDVSLQLEDDDHLPSNEYQIFELNQESEASTPLSSEWHSNLEEFTDSPIPSNKQPLMQELKLAMEKRKEECISKEIAALAKCRNVAIQEIDRIELDRDLFVEQKDRIKPQVSRPVYGGMPTVSDLQTILRQRNNLMRGSAGDGVKEEVFGCNEGLDGSDEFFGENHGCQKRY